MNFDFFVIEATQSTEVTLSLDTPWKCLGIKEQSEGRLELAYIKLCEPFICGLFTFDQVTNVLDN